MRPGISAAVLPFCVAVLGCGESKTAPIEGTVVYADAPDVPAADLAGYVVTFESEGERPSSATGEVGADGTFRMSTFKDGDGALRGKQRVAITPPVSHDGVRAQPKILTKYMDLRASGLTVDVQPGTNQVKLVVERRPKGK